MDTAVQKGLADRLYDRRKTAALEYVMPFVRNLVAFHTQAPAVQDNCGYTPDDTKAETDYDRLEAIIRSALAAGDHDRIAKIVHQLCHDYAYAIHQPHARNGGLIGLAAAAIALGSDVAPYLREIVPPVLACFSDQDARVRYYACESMYNIAKVAKGDILIFFNDVFDALCKLASDTEHSVKNGAELLDRLVKDIVSESAATYAGIMVEPLTDDKAQSNDNDPSSQNSQEMRPAFSLAKFIPLLQDRILALSPFVRTFLVSWITLLDSIPDLELVVYLPSFLGGLLKFLSDPNQDVHTTTKIALDRFLNEIKKIAVVQRGLAENRRDREDHSRKPSDSSVPSPKSPPPGEKEAEAQGRQADAESGEAGVRESPDGGDDMEDESTPTDPDDDEKDGNSMDDEWIPGQDVRVDYQRILDILIDFLSTSSEEEIQLTTLKWIESFFDICPDDILTFTPRLLAQVLPALSHDVDHVKQAASRVNSALMDYIMSLPEEPTTTTHPTKPEHPPLPAAAQQLLSPSNLGLKALRDSYPVEIRDSPQGLRGSRRQTEAEVESINRTPTIATPEPPEMDDERAASPTKQPRTVDLDYEACVSALTLQFLHKYEATRVAAIAWLIMLHRKSPRKILAINDGTFPALLKTLSDPAEAVVTRDLLLLSQISKNSDDSYFTSFMVNLLKLFCTDRRLLETRGNLIIRQLCLSLSAERIYRTMADCLERDEDDIEFASIMVQNLNNNLITAPELQDLRKRLRNLDSRDGQTFFTVLFRAWCVNAVATFSLCLLAQAYEQAYHLLQIFAELEMTVNMLIQIDKLVQLLESPVFTYLRMQLLEPEKFPHLYKCLYGLLMLLPQSSAFAALKNRLNSVSAIGYLHVVPRTTPSLPNTPSTVSTFERQNRLKNRDEAGIRWTELLDKFRATQDKLRRAQQKQLGGHLDEPTTPEHSKHSNKALLSIRGASEYQRGGSTSHSASGAGDGTVRSGSAQSIGRPGQGAAQNTQTASVLSNGGQSKTKSSLGRLGGLAGGGRKGKK